MVIQGTPLFAANEEESYQNVRHRINDSLRVLLVTLVLLLFLDLRDKETFRNPESESFIFGKMCSRALYARLPITPPHFYPISRYYSVFVGGRYLPLMRQQVY